MTTMTTPTPAAETRAESPAPQPPHPSPQPGGVVVPAAVIDALVGIALSTEVGKGIMIGFRVTTWVPLDVHMKIGVHDGRLVPISPNSEGKR